MATDGARFGWIVSYPKSGNTWLRMMLSSLLADGAPVEINESAENIGISSYAEMDEFLGVETSELTTSEIADAQPALHAAILSYAAEPLVLRKVHDRFWRTLSGKAVFDGGLSRGAIYLIRDPKDVAVSYAHHRGTTIDRIIEIMADSAWTIDRAGSQLRPQLPQPLGRWSEHVVSWVDQREVPTLVLRYEDMLADTAGCLAAAAQHLGIAAQSSTIHASVAATRFESLRAQEQANGFLERHPGSSAAFFRRGVAGDWRNWLSPDQERRIISDHGQVMARFRYR